MVSKIKYFLLLSLLLVVILPTIHPIFSSKVSTGKDSGITTFGYRDNMEDI